MVKGHWGGDCGGCAWFVALLAGVGGMVAPWWFVEFEAATTTTVWYHDSKNDLPQETPTIEVGLWNSKMSDSTRRDPEAERFGFRSVCKDGIAPPDYLTDIIRQGDCDLYIVAQAFLGVNIGFQILGLVAAALNRSKKDQTLIPAACLALVGGAFSMASVVVAAVMPLSEKAIVASSIGFVASMVSLLFALLGAGGMVVAKHVHKQELEVPDVLEAPPDDDEEANQQDGKAPPPDVQAEAAGGSSPLHGCDASSTMSTAVGSAGMSPPNQLESKEQEAPQSAAKQGFFRDDGALAGRVFACSV